MKEFKISWREQGDLYTKIINCNDEDEAFKTAENLLGHSDFSIEEESKND